MNNQIIEQVKEFYEESFEKATPEQKDFFEDHVEKVVKFAKKFAEERNADLEIVEISAWLHDIASILGKYKEHHIEGAKIAEEFLKSINYPQEKIDLVKDCILNHRGSKERNVTTKEAQILIDADAMTHFEEIGVLRKFYKTDAEILGKFERSYNKMSDEAKKIIKPQLDKARKELS